MSKFRAIILKKDTRTFTRSDINGNTLSNADIRWLRKGAEVNPGEPLKMTYDHDTKTVVPLIGYMPDRFIIVSELEANPWHVVPPNPDEGMELCMQTVTVTFHQVGDDYTASISFNTLKRSQEVGKTGSIISLCEQIDAHIQQTLSPIKNFSMQTRIPKIFGGDCNEIGKFITNVTHALTRH